MVIFAVKLHLLSFKISAYPSKNWAQIVEYFFGEYVTPILGYKDQVYMHH